MTVDRRWSTRRRLLQTSAAWAAVGFLGCTGRAAGQQKLSVFAASSLQDVFAALEAAFTAGNPGAAVSLTFAGSQILRLQIEHGAPADVFASADVGHMKALVDAGLVVDPEPFASNELVVITPRSDPARIESFDDLPRARRLVVGSEEVPVGRYTAELLVRARADRGDSFADVVRSRIVSRESNVRLVRAKVELGEADAAIVYRTDAVASDRVRTIPIPSRLNVRTDYLAAFVKGSPNAELAHRWLAHLHSEQGRTILRNHAFGTP